MAESFEPDVDESAPAEVHAISRRRFLIQMGGLAATLIIAGAGVAEILRVVAPLGPAPGTRPDQTPVAKHFRVDINLDPPGIDETTWRLTVDGLVDKPLSLTLGQLRSGFKRKDQFVTLSCISNPLGGPFIGTTRWGGVPLREVLARAQPQAGARYARITAADGFDEEVDLESVGSDARIALVYSWDGQPLPPRNGFPLRICVPDRYGMKQPKWITGITLTADSAPGYWVRQNWDAKAEVKTTSVIDTVAVKSLVTRGGRTYIPIGGIAYSGAKGISKVEIQVDDSPWQGAELREPLSELTWVIWRFDWPFTQGTHSLAVRAYDGQGRLQVTEETNSAVGTAITGLYKEYRTIGPAQP